MEWLRGLFVVLAVVVGVWLALAAVIRLHRPSRHLAGAALRLLPDMLRMLRALVADPGTPRRERWLLIGLFAWLASPIDLLPEFLPGIGPLDDIVVAALVLRWVARRLGRDTCGRTGRATMTASACWSACCEPPIRLARQRAAMRRQHQLRATRRPQGRTPISRPAACEGLSTTGSPRGTVTASIAG